MQNHYFRKKRIKNKAYLIEKTNHLFRAGAGFLLLEPPKLKTNRLSFQNPHLQVRNYQQQSSLIVIYKNSNLPKYWRILEI